MITKIDCDFERFRNLLRYHADGLRITLPQTNVILENYPTATWPDDYPYIVMIWSYANVNFRASLSYEYDDFWYLSISAYLDKECLMDYTAELHPWRLTACSISIRTIPGRVLPD